MKNTTSKKALLFDPYLDTVGGGEKHILSILSVFASHGYSVDILWDDLSILHTVKDRLNIEHKNFFVRQNFLARPFFSKLSATHEYDVLFYVTDGSYFFSRAKKNYVFCMYPDEKLYDISLTNRAKLTNFQFFANSSFTSQYIQTWTGREVGVIFPYVDPAFFTTAKKEPIILSVGRFFQHLHTKRHDVILTAFKKLKQKEQAREYRLIITGSLQKGEEEWLEKLKTLAGKDPSISFVVNPSFEKLVSLYRSARIYWHAAGYGVDAQQEPDKVEHLGLTPLEALAAGCITFAHASGGPKETIPQAGGILYDEIEELVEKTVNLIDNGKKLESLSEQGRRYIRDNFSYDIFEKKVIEYFQL